MLHDFVMYSIIFKNKYILNIMKQELHYPVAVNELDIVIVGVSVFDGEVIVPVSTEES